MTAGQAVAAALRARLGADRATAGVAIGDGAGPAAGVLPAVRIDAGQASDWSTKDRPGRELRVATTVRAGSAEPHRLAALVAAAERAGTAIAGRLDGGWEVASAVLLRSRIGSGGGGGAKGEGVALVEHRIRVLGQEA